VLEGFNYNDYVNRYCMDGRSRFNKFMKYKGCSNYDELSLVIGGMMVRRTKDDVMSDLPRKYRKHVLLGCMGGCSSVRTTGTMRRINSDDSGNTGRMGLINNFNARDTANTPNITPLDDVDHTIMEMYAQAAEIKLSSVVSYVREYINQHIKDKKNKLVIFCHHKCMITGIINALDVGYIKIDGSVNSSIRQRLVNSFQLDDNIKVAMLSITSANTGLNLTAADTVIFSELYWNPGNLLQAEDRVHRIGQRKDVEVYFLLGKGTIDEMVWPKIVGKLGVLERLGVGENVLKSVGERKGGNILSVFERIKDGKASGGR
ncbi:Chromatin remodeling protein HARP/SMARCAL1, DEAD-box superfamily, partial [Trachipleistophora hominis]